MHGIHALGHDDPLILELLRTDPLGLEEVALLVTMVSRSTVMYGDP